MLPFRATIWCRFRQQFVAWCGQALTLQRIKHVVHFTGELLGLFACPLEHLFLHADWFVGLLLVSCDRLCYQINDDDRPMLEVRTKNSLIAFYFDLQLVSVSFMTLWRQHRSCTRCPYLHFVSQWNWSLVRCNCFSTQSVTHFSSSLYILPRFRHSVTLTK